MGSMSMLKLIVKGVDVDVGRKFVDISCVFIVIFSCSIEAKSSA